MSKDGVRLWWQNCRRWSCGFHTRKLIQLSEFNSWVQYLFFSSSLFIPLYLYEKEVFVVCVQLNWNWQVYQALNSNVITNETNTCTGANFLWQIIFSCFLVRHLIRLWAVSLFLENPWGKTQNKQVYGRDWAWLSVTCDARAPRGSHVTLTVTLARLLVLRSSARLFEEKGDCSQSKISFDKFSFHLGTMSVVGHWSNHWVEGVSVQS